MKIISWNVNGLRSVCRDYNFTPWLMRESPDVILLQEVKATEKDLPDDCKNIPDYNFVLHHAEVKKGYSGVALYSNTKPAETSHGIGIGKFDQEGRVLTSFFDNLAIISVYVPNGGRGQERHAYKIEFLAAFLDYLKYLEKKGYNIVFGGDINIARENIDVYSPEEAERMSGFQPDEREMLEEIIAAGYIDTFRHFYPDKERAYTWWNQLTSGRGRNLGWRIDYLFISQSLLPRLRSAGIMSSVLGSDHCPVFVELV